jgi:hypothetical protein
LRLVDSFGMRCGLTKRVVSPSTRRSSMVRFGAPCRERLHRNPKFGCVRITQQIAHAFGIGACSPSIFRPGPGANGPSWLTLIAHAKDSAWSVDLFRVDSILFRSHWVMLVMDVFTRRIIGFHIAPHALMACRCAACSIAPPPGDPNRNTSVPITIRSFAFTLARQPARAGGRGDHVGSVRSDLASVRRPADRNDPA